MSLKYLTVALWVLLMPAYAVHVPQRLFVGILLSAGHSIASAAHQIPYETSNLSSRLSLGPEGCTPWNGCQVQERQPVARRSLQLVSTIGPDGSADAPADPLDRETEQQPRGMEQQTPPQNSTGQEQNSSVPAEPEIAPAESNQLARALDDEHTAFTILLPVDAAINQLVSRVGLITPVSDQLDEEAIRLISHQILTEPFRLNQAFLQSRETAELQNIMNVTVSARVDFMSMVVFQCGTKQTTMVFDTAATIYGQKNESSIVVHRVADFMGDEVPRRGKVNAGLIAGVVCAVVAVAAAFSALVIVKRRSKHRRSEFYELSAIATSSKFASIVRNPRVRRAWRKSSPSQEKINLPNSSIRLISNDIYEPRDSNEAHFDDSGMDQPTPSHVANTACTIAPSAAPLLGSSAFLDSDVNKKPQHQHRGMSSSPSTLTTIQGSTHATDLGPSLSQPEALPYFKPVNRPSQNGAALTSLGSTMGLRRMPPPPRDAGARPWKEYVAYQLDTLQGREILEGYEQQEGLDARATGGQAVVQMAVHARSRQEVAIKFYVSRTAFQDEAAQYSDAASPLRSLLPRCLGIHDNADSSFVDGNGMPMPPCIVMEKGESLDRWVRRNHRDMDQFTCMQVVHHICECLMDLHTAGYAHRDIKPGNIMWLPSQNRWTLIDFGCATPLGTIAGKAFTLPYAAPEAVQAAFRQGEPIRVTTALDAWSVGVLAVELFTGGPALTAAHAPRQQIIAQLVGEQSLPWETGGPMAALLRQRAGRFRRAVLGLLHRNPEKRTLVPAFMQIYAAIMASSSQHSPPLLSAASSATGTDLFLPDNLRYDLSDAKHLSAPASSSSTPPTSGSASVAFYDAPEAPSM